MSGETNHGADKETASSKPDKVPQYLAGPPKQPPPPPYLPIGQRLYNLRRRAESPVIKVGLLGCIPLSIFGFIGLYILFVFSLVGYGFSGAAGYGFEEALVIAVIVFMLILAAACAYGLIWLARTLFNKFHREALDFMYRSTFPLVILDGVYVAEIIEKIEAIYSLRWISAPAPKTIEQQLEFAACYHHAYRRIHWGPGRLDGGSVWRGSFAWFVGQRMCCVCGCLSMNSYFFAIAIPFWIMGGIAYLQRLGTLAAYCDYLMSEELQAELPQAWRGY